jgi:thymidylate synthase
MKNYLKLLQDIAEHGYDHEDRTGTGRRTLIGQQLRFKMSEGFPLVTTRKMYTRNIIVELLWFISGSSDVRVLQEQGNNFWDLWAVNEHSGNGFIERNPTSDVSEFLNDEDVLKGHIELCVQNSIGSVGPIYGPQWRNAPGSPTAYDRELDVSDIPKDKIEQYNIDFFEDYGMKKRTRTDISSLTKIILIIVVKDTLKLTTN